ncbi:ferric reductase-like protein [Spathaspora passalidarum NRRL Y-27907]|uniref:Probable metalloreductase AIM14 n=1 Tax=Spathaspora passalidarum (strain NRRL Y-27907 / 11-Y1) TaxID=619300 RepID=G3AMQ8_SPAPN|nr:ferric reductase-like protein [Spathaspora passalidarum NRRL Y-27907]EGW33502.1 ferric reductase-like protein [Spathaspora passalidarum NRRL Y-27907]
MSLLESNDIDLHPRHGDHHFVNVKYGYVILAFSLVHIICRLGSKNVYLRQWSSTGSHSRLLRMYSSIPTWVVIALWVLCIFFVGGHHIEDLSEEYVVVAKRYGRIAYCLIPLNIFLILRPTNIYFWKIGYYLENLNLHKWLSRLIALCATVHAVTYTVKWLKEGATAEKSFKILNLLGVITFYLFVVLVVISVRILRRRFYNFFYIFHNITAWSMVLLIALHARPGVSIIALLNLALLMYQLYLRYISVYKVDNIKVIDSPGSTLQLININVPGKFPSWLPASHIRLNYSRRNISSWVLPTHPFTIATITEDNTPNISLIVKKNNFQFNTNQDYLLTGPYPSLPPPFFNSAKSVNIICGGSGISFGLPVFNYVKTCNTFIPIKMIWCVRNQSDTFITKHLDMTGVQVYITSILDSAPGESSGSSKTTPDSSTASLQQLPVFVIEDEEQTHGLLDDDIELQTLNPGKEGSERLPEKSANTFNLGRPKLDEVFAIDDPTTVEDKKNCWVIACGPDELIKDAKTWAKDREYEFFFEKYEM